MIVAGLKTGANAHRSRGHGRACHRRVGTSRHAVGAPLPSRPAKAPSAPAPRQFMPRGGSRQCSAPAGGPVLLDDGARPRFVIVTGRDETTVGLFVSLSVHNDWKCPMRSLILAGTAVLALSAAPALANSAGKGQSTQHDSTQIERSTGDHGTQSGSSTLDQRSGTAGSSGTQNAPLGSGAAGGTAGGGVGSTGATPSCPAGSPPTAECLGQTGPSGGSSGQ